jgi:predicted short-subunit dehydrogenase-like oxidoreductase (DUF2520 family)
MSFRVGLVGCGRVGSFWLRAGMAQGHLVDARVRTIASVPGDIQGYVKELHSLELAEWSEFDFIILATPEDSWEPICNQLKLAVCGSDETQGPIVVHTSGVASHEVLSSYGFDGEKCGAIHPLFPFRSADESPAGDSVIHGVSGPLHVVEKCEALIASLNGRSFRLKNEQRALYHLACVIASNHVVTLAALAQTLGEEASEDPGNIKLALTNLMRASVENLQAVSEPSEALSGPVSRGDVLTGGALPPAHKAYGWTCTKGAQRSPRRLSGATGLAQERVRIRLETSAGIPTRIGGPQKPVPRDT